MKNPLAIAAGMVAGLELGHNAMSAMVTRGLAEMTRLGLSLGADMATLAGLAGMGDLVLTCTGSLSRNRTVGARLAKGETIEEITSSMRQVAEGVKNTKTILSLAQRKGVEMPIIEAVKRVLDQETTPERALDELMNQGAQAGALLGLDFLKKAVFGFAGRRDAALPASLQTHCRPSHRAEPSPFLLREARGAFLQVPPDPP